MEAPSIDQFIDFSHAHALHYQGTGMVAREIHKMFFITASSWSVSTLFFSSIKSLLLC